MTVRDLRPAASLSLRGLRLKHWTAPYLFYRIRAMLRSRRHPDAPSLTPQAINFLAHALDRRHVGVEWGSGNTTRWFARRTRHLVSFETSDSYYAQVQATLAAEALTNVDYRLVPFVDDDDEKVMHESAWVRSAHAVEPGSIDYALVDSSPRGCLCAAIAPRLKPGGLLILDNANWYIPPPDDIRPRAPGSVSALLGTTGSRIAGSLCWPAFAAMTAGWRAMWSSDGVQMTLILVKPSAAADAISDPVNGRSAVAIVGGEASASAIRPRGEP